jgi:hypothetical protein
VDMFQRCLVKVTRTVEHLKGLQASAERFSDEHGEPGVWCATEPNSQGTRCLVTVDRVPEFPEVEWGVIIGDAIHCLRSALDHLIAGLCTEPPSRRTAFPICRTKREWIVDAPGEIWSVPPKYLALIDAAQPYHGGDKAHAHPLAVLNQLWNLDKHRSITAAALVPKRVDIAVNEQRSIGLTSWTKFKTHPGRPLKSGTVLADCGFTTDPTVAEAKMYVDAHLTVDIGFGAVPEASSISHKPVNETFKDSLIPAVIKVIVAAKLVHDGHP